MLVTSSLVAVRGMARSLHSNFGFQPQNAVLATTDLDMSGYSGDRVAAMQRRMLDTLQTLPGVTAVGLIDRLPLAMDWDDEAVFKDSTSDLRLSNQTAEAGMQGISPGYLHAAGSSLLAGKKHHLARRRQGSSRGHRESGSSPASSLAPKQLHLADISRRWTGSASRSSELSKMANIRPSPKIPGPAMFMPILQAPSSSTWLVLRSNRDPQQLAAAVRIALHNLDPAVPVTTRTWNKQLGSALFASRVATVSLGVLGGLGAMLAVTGIFGMASYSVSKRLRGWASASPWAHSPGKS